MGVTSRRNLQLGAHHQRVGELAGRAHGGRRDGAMVAGDKVHEAKADGLHTRVRSNVKGVVHGPGRLQQHMDGQLGGRAPQAQKRRMDLLHIGQRFHLGDHQVAQAVRRLPGNGGQVARKSRVIHRVYAGGHAGLGLGREGQRGNQRRVLGLAAHGGAVFTVERDVKHASAELLAHFGLQLQAFAHAHFHAAVVVAHREHAGGGLRPQQHITRVGHTLVAGWLSKQGPRAQTKWATPACSSVSSLSVLLMHS